MKHVDFAEPNEIVVGIELAVELRVKIREQLVGQPGSSKDVEADGAVAVAADDFEVFESSEIVGSAEFQAVASRQGLDSPNVHSLPDLVLCDYSQDVGPM